LAINPATADLVPGLTTAFTITGGRPPYSAFSTNNGVLPVTATVAGSTFSVTPNTVTADTPIDLTVRDALNASATAKVIVRFTGAPLAINPATVTVFPDLPATFTISGGSGAYSAFSSNAAVLTVPTTVTGTSFTVVPNAVTADTAVDITARDGKGTTVTSKVTVKPSSLLNQITFTPLTPTGADCGTNTICAGGDAQIVVKAARNGLNLPSRKIRFEVFQGSFQFITPALPVTTDSGKPVNSLEILTNDQGEAVVRITANAGATTQVATLQTTDVTDSASPLVRRYNFNIIRSVSGVAVLSVLPSATVTITGERGNTLGANGSCPTGSTVDYYIFGGTPPYTVASPRTDVAPVSPTAVLTNGGKFTAQIKDCVTVSFVVSDSSGRTLETSALVAERGGVGFGLPASSFVVSPASLTIVCGTSGGVTVSGVGTYTTNIIGVTSGAGLRVTASTGPLSTSGTNVTISALAASTFSSPVVEFSDGTLKSSVAVRVTNTVGAVVNSCP